MKTPFIETDCTITHNGHTFESGGAVITADYATVYTNNDLTRVQTWHGQDLGPITRKSSWRIFSFVSDRMYHIHATINGRRYNGRTAGAGMIARLRESK